MHKKNHKDIFKKNSEEEFPILNNKAICETRVITMCVTGTEWTKGPVRESREVDPYTLT